MDVTRYLSRGCRYSIDNRPSKRVKKCYSGLKKDKESKMFEYFTENAYWTIFNLLAKISLANVCWVLTYYFEYWAVYVNGQLISKCPSGVIVWTKVATKNFDNFCPGGQIKKIKALSYINYGVFNVIKCLYFFDLTTRAEIVKFFRC